MKNILTFKLLILLVGIFYFALQSCHIYAQEQTKRNPFQLVYDGTDDFENLVAVNFINQETGEFIQTFDLIDNNPYNHLDYPVDEEFIGIKRNKIYRLNNIKLKDIKLPKGNLIISPEYSEAMLIDDVTTNSYFSILKNSEGSLVIMFTFSIGYYPSIAFSNILLFFDEKGNITNELVNLNTDVNSFGITKNRKYFSYSFSIEKHTNNTHSASNLGYVVVNSSTMRLIKKEYINDYYKVEVLNTNNFIRVSCLSDSRDDNIIIYDFEKNKKYERIVTQTERRLWKSISEKGFVFERNTKNSNVYDTLYFNKDFKVEAIK